MQSCATMQYFMWRKFWWQIPLFTIIKSNTLDIKIMSSQIGKDQGRQNSITDKNIWTTVVTYYLLNFGALGLGFGVYCRVCCRDTTGRESRLVSWKVKTRRHLEMSMTWPFGNGNPEASTLIHQNDEICVVCHNVKYNPFILVYSIVMQIGQGLHQNTHLSTCLSPAPGHPCGSHHE